jgi:hypothetical protein
MMSSQQQQQQPRKHTMVGGYSNLGHDDKKLLKSEEVVKVANFALKEYAAKTTIETETAATSSSELQHDSLTVSPEQVESGEVTAVVLEAHRQVRWSLNEYMGGESAQPSFLVSNRHILFSIRHYNSTLLGGSRSQLQINHSSNERRFQQNLSRSNQGHCI